MDEDYPAWYEPEDCGCECTENGTKSQWEWMPDFGYYVCSGCGE